LERPGPLRLAATLALGICAVSCGSIFARLASAPALAVAAYRCVWGAVLLAPALLSGPIRELRRLSPGEWARIALSGAALAFHFALWIASLRYTTVASSVLLVDTTPFFLGLANRWLAGARLRRSFWAGLALAFAGCAVVFRGDLALGSEAVRGNLLALGGALAMAVYLQAGSAARQRLSLVAYVWPVYAASGAALVAASLAFATPLGGFSRATYLFLFLLGLVPQCVGHTTYNWALRWLQPALVAIVGLAEPVGASLLAWVVLGERLTLEKLAGGAIILGGIYVAAKK